MTLRFFMLGAHYRSTLDLTDLSWGAAVLLCFLSHQLFLF